MMFPDFGPNVVIPISLLVAALGVCLIVWIIGLAIRKHEDANAVADARRVTANSQRVLNEEEKRHQWQMTELAARGQLLDKQKQTAEIMLALNATAQGPAVSDQAAGIGTDDQSAERSRPPSD